MKSRSRVRYLCVFILAGFAAAQAAALDAKYQQRRDSAQKSYVASLLAFASQAGNGGDRIHFRTALRRALAAAPEEKRASGLAGQFEAAGFFETVRSRGGTNSAIFQRNAAMLENIEQGYAKKLVDIARIAGSAGDETSRLELLAEAFRHAPYSLTIAKDLNLKWNQAFGWVDDADAEKLKHNTWTYIRKNACRVEDLGETVKQMKEAFVGISPDVQQYREIKGQRVAGISNVADNTVEDKLVHQLTIESRDLLIALGLDTRDAGIIHLVLLKDKAEYGRFVGSFGVPAEVIEKTGGVYIGSIGMLFSYQSMWQAGGQLESTIFHESAHALLASVFEKAPTWFHECVATLSQSAKVEARRDALGLNSYFIFNPPPERVRAEVAGSLRPGNFTVKDLLSDRGVFMSRQAQAYATAEALAWTMHYSGVLPEVFSDLKSGRDALETISARLAVPPDKIDLVVLEFMAYLPAPK